MVLIAVSCEERPGSDGSITIDGGTQITLSAAATDTTVSFSATAAWTVITEDIEWIGIEPAGGAAGEFEAALSVLENNSSEPRTAVITFCAEHPRQH